jgi:subtilisin family serine protease
MDRTGGCQVTLSGAAAYVSTCAADHIIAIVPWGATSGDVVVSADGVKSRGFPVEVTARSRSSDAYASESLVPGIIEVKLAAGADEETIALRNQGSPEDFVEDASLDHWYRVSVPVGQEVPKAAAYGGDPDVLYSSPLSLPESGDAPNDELYSQQWGLSQISAEAAWTRSKGDGITIAVIDTGFATGHPDLGPHMLPGWNCNQTSDVLPLSSHGTQVAGVAAAYTNNGPGSGSGIAGVGWNSRILPLRLNTMDGLGTCNTSEESFLIMKAIAGGAKVVNMSYSYPTWPRESVCETMRRAANVGLVLVSSAGNSNSSAPVAPATCSEVIAVGATGPDNSKASYSNFGSWLDISAPGGAGDGGLLCSSTLVDRIRTTNYPADSEPYTWSCGTSVSAPHVSGVAALLAGIGLRGCDIRETLIDSENVDQFNGGWQGGAGRLNAAKALSNPKFCPASGYVPQADYGSDGKSDLGHLCYPTSPNNCQGKETIWHGQVGGGFTTTEYERASLFYDFLDGTWQTGDFNGDGKTDQIHLDGAFETWLSSGNGQFQPAFLAPGPGYDTMGGQWLSGNFDGNLNTDLVHLRLGEMAAKVWQSLGDGSFTITELPLGYTHVGSEWQIGDLNGDRLGDLIHFRGTTFLTVWLSNGDGTFTKTDVTAPPGHNLQMGRWRVGDFSGDGKSDLLHLSEDVHIWLSSPGGTSFTIQQYTPVGHDVLAGHFRAGDFDGDGKSDVLHLSGTGTAYIWRSGGFTFSQPVALPTGGGYPSVWTGHWRTGDFNGDGKTDLTHLCCTSSARVWYGRASSPFLESPQTFSQSGTLAGAWVESDHTGDRDGDGWLDGADGCPTTRTIWKTPIGDSDCDGFTNANEQFVGTNTSNDCAATSTLNDEPPPDMWPVDLNDSRSVTTVDVGFYVGKFGSQAPGPPYDVRLDLNMDGQITTVDTGRFVPFLGLSFS